MITAAYARSMADYNRWQNDNLYGCAEKLSDAQRKEPRAAFFGSIHGTLNHILWADQVWMCRFTPTVRPPAAKRPLESVDQYKDWTDLKRARTGFDAIIGQWTDGLDEDWLRADLTWFSRAAGREVTKPRWLLVAHMFNHQTHHRGQVHCLLTQCGLKPGDTDLPFQP